MANLTQERLKELLHYDPDTGVFTWIKKSKKSTVIGSVAGSKHNQGYLATSIDWKRYLLHRLAWLYVYAEFPTGLIDHINRNRSDNRISNLRVVSRSENQQNHNLFKTNKSGVAGVSWTQKDNRWRARIWLNGKTKNLGHFKTFEEAVLARKQAEKEFYSLPE